jgi:hypothetical protein
MMLISWPKTNAIKENTQGLSGASKEVGLDVSAEKERDRERSRSVCSCLQKVGHFKIKMVNKSFEEVGIAQSVRRQATGWTAGIRFALGERSFSYPQRPDWLCGPPRFLFKEYVGFLPRG